MRKVLVSSLIFANLRSFFKEIETVLTSVIQYNETQRISYVRRHAFDGWRQLVEVSVAACSLDIFTVERRVQMIADVLVEVLTLVNVKVVVV